MIKKRIFLIILSLVFSAFISSQLRIEIKGGLEDPINIAIVTISDTRVLDNDKSGDVLEERVLKSKHRIISRNIVKDNFDEIYKLFSNLINNEKIDVVISTGGTVMKNVE